jgi:hypothetical protein
MTIVGRAKKSLKKIENRLTVKGLHTLEWCYQKPFLGCVRDSPGSKSYRGCLFIVDSDGYWIEIILNIF